MRTLALELDAWVGKIEGSASLQVVLDVAPRNTHRPPCGGLLSLAVEGRSVLLAVRAVGLGGTDPWCARIEAQRRQVYDVEALLLVVPAIRITEFGSDGSWTAKYARGGMPIEPPAAFAPHLRLISIRVSLVTARFAATVARMEHG